MDPKPEQERESIDPVLGSTDDASQTLSQEAWEGEPKRSMDEPKNAVAVKDPQKAIAIEPEQFGKLDQDGAAALKEHNVERITVLPKGDHDLVVAQRKE